MRCRSFHLHTTGPARIPGSPPPNPTYILCPVEPVLRTVNQEEPVSWCRWWQPVPPGIAPWMWIFRRLVWSPAVVRRCGKSLIEGFADRFVHANPSVGDDGNLAARRRSVDRHPVSHPKPALGGIRLTGRAVHPPWPPAHLAEQCCQRRDDNRADEKGVQE